MLSDDEGDGPPVVDEGSSKKERNLRVEVSVRTEAGEPAENALIRLNNRENDDPTVGRTDANGRLVFIDSVGPAPYNDMVVSVPSLGITEPLDCHNGDKTIEAVIRP